MKPSFLSGMSLRSKLGLLSITIILPFLVVTVLFMFQLSELSSSYDLIVKNITGANAYSIVFKEEMDSVMYQMVARSLNKEEIEEELSMKNPDTLIEMAYNDFSDLEPLSESREAKERIQSILKLLDTLRKRADEINDTVKISGHYDENMKRLDTDIYIITELIQERITEYIYYESESMENTRIEIEERRKVLINLAIITMMLILFATVILSIVISGSITKPIDELCSATNEVAHGDFSVRTDISTGGELMQLSSSLNSMTEQLGDLVENIKKEQINSRNLELKLLQAQINPHFLYNTLDNIVWLSEDGRKDEVASIVTSLSTFFRTTLSGGRDFIRIGDEISHIKAYLEIQQFRYSDIMDYRIDIPEEYMDYSIIKLTLQPIVENALYHGIKYKRSRGTIRLGIYERSIEDVRNRDIFKGVEKEAKRDGHIKEGKKELHEAEDNIRTIEQLVLTVSDDGKGMTGEELARLERIVAGKEKPSIDNRGFGISNVAERLKLNYGENCGLSFKSSPEDGTLVEIIIPKVRFDPSSDA